MPDRDPADMATRFAAGRVVETVTRLGGGHINDSYLVRWRDAGRRDVLQRINPRVFSDPRQVMDNLVRVLEHLAGRGPCLELVPTHGGLPYDDSTGAVWRMTRFVERARTVDAPTSADAVHAAARAFGVFQRHLADLPPATLHEVIPGFHDTPRYCVQLAAAASAAAPARRSAAGPTLARIQRFTVLADALAGLRQRVPARAVHNDAKIANALFDAAATAVVCIIDLDTVMPGLSVHDVGDMIRTMTSAAAEDAGTAADAVVDERLYAAVIDGYLTGAGSTVTADERAHLFTAGRVITFEQAVRFLADYLRGDVYYRVSDPEQNLRRAQRQLCLLESLDARAAELRACAAPRSTRGAPARGPRRPRHRGQ